MKKCVKCNKKYDDSVLICDSCGLYLIEDVVSDLGNDPKTFSSSVNSNNRRRRVVPIEEPEPSTYGSSRRQHNTNPRQSGFEPSSETVEVPNTSSGTASSHRRRRRNSSFVGFIRRYYPIIRIAVPIVLFIIALIWIIANWEIVSEFLQCCIISGLVGAGLLTFLSVRFGHHFNVDIMTGGAIAGIIIGCLLKYNILGTATGLYGLFMGIGPCIIMIIGIYIMFRGIR